MSLQSPPTKATIEWRVRCLAGAFFLVFFAFSTSQLMESTLHGSSGYMCLSGLYGAFSISLLLSPYLISLCPENLLTTLLFSASVPYLLMTASNLLPRMEAVMLLACVGVGVGAGPLWGSQGVFIGRSTLAHCAATGEGKSTTSTKLNALFYSIWMGSGFVSNTMASVILLTSTDLEKGVYLLFTLLSIVGCVGCGALLLLQAPGAPGKSLFTLPYFFQGGVAAVKGDPALLSTHVVSASASDLLPIQTSPSQQEVARGVEASGGGKKKEAWIPWPEVESGGSDDGVVCATSATTASTAAPSNAPPPAPPTPLTMLRFMLTKREVWFIAPLAFSAGLGQGFLVGAWFRVVVGGTVGASWVGLVGASFSLTSATAASIWGPLAQRPTFGRRWAFVIGHIVLLLWFLSNSLVWWASGREGDSSSTAAAPNPSNYGLVAVLFAATACFSSVDPIMQAFTSATMQCYFPEAPYLACAVAAPRFFYAIGFSSQQFLALALANSLGRPAISEQCILQAALVCISGFSLRHLHSIADIDGRGKAASPSPSPPTDTATNSK